MDTIYIIVSVIAVLAAGILGFTISRRNDRNGNYSRVKRKLKSQGESIKREKSELKQQGKQLKSERDLLESDKNLLERERNGLGRERELLDRDKQLLEELRSRNEAKSGR